MRRFPSDYETSLMLFVDELQPYTNVSSLREKVHPGMDLEDIATAQAELINAIHEIENMLLEPQ